MQKYLCFFFYLIVCLDRLQANNNNNKKINNNLNIQVYTIYVLTKVSNYKLLEYIK